MSLESPVKAEVVEEAYEAEDENDDDSPLIKREVSDFDLQTHEAAAGKDWNAPTDKEMNEGTDELEDRIDGYSQKSGDNQTEDVSDPGIGKSDFLGSPELKRSCSNLENQYVLRKIAQYLPPSNSQSFEDFQELSANPMVNFERSRSMISHCSADKVMLKRHSSSQVLPSLLLWSHRNIHNRPFSKDHQPLPEGLRELTRLQVLDLSYNCISRIGQGLSSCTLIKELYLSGNKISDVEGLHRRLFKLTVLDLSFNKITTTKALGQLVANYNSIQALNLLGNPIQRNISDEQLKKAVCGLLPKLTYLNKQPLKA